MRLMENIDQNRDCHQRSVRNHREPPENPLVLFNLQIFQNFETNQQTSDGTAKMRRVTNVLVQIEDIAIVDGRANVGAGDYEED